MNRRQKIIVSVTGIFLVLLLLVGLTYAYFLTRITGNTNDKSISVSTANLAIVYGNDDGSVIGEGEKITPGTTFEPKTFTVTNNGNANTDYVVVIEDASVTYAETIEVDGETQTAGTEATFESNDFTYTLTCESGCNSVQEPITFPIEGGILVGNRLDVGETQTYSFTLTYNETGENQSNDMNKKLEAKINIKDISTINPYSDKPNTLAYNIINNAILGTTGTTLVSVPLTNIAESISQYGTGKFSYETVSTDNLCAGTAPWLVGDTPSAAQSGAGVSSYDDAVGKYVYDACSEWVKYLDSYDSTTSTLSFKVETMEDESALSMTNDDYGISYYYRGNVIDNYVTFAGMCWRIVRIDGNNNIKLILEDQDEVCSTTMNGNWNIEASDGTSITMDGSNPLRKGNFGIDGSRKMAYLNPVKDPDRAMVNSLKYFQTNTLTDKISNTYSGKNLSDYLVSGNWCLNNKAYSDETGNALLENPTYTSSFYYDSFVRLYGKTILEPTLKCQVKAMETFGDNTTPMFVGTITADEIVYAGGKVGEKVLERNPNFYLINNCQKTNGLSFWSLSPGSFDGINDSAFVVHHNGSLNATHVGYLGISFRPSVSLKFGVVISEGEGTLDKPYKIAE